MIMASSERPSDEDTRERGQFTTGATRTHPRGSRSEPPTTDDIMGLRRTSPEEEEFAAASTRTHHRGSKSEPPTIDDILEMEARIPEEELSSSTRSNRPGGFLRQAAERFELNILASEDVGLDDENVERARILRRQKTIRRSEHHKSLITRAIRASGTPRWRQDDPYFDMKQDKEQVLEIQGVRTLKVPTLKMCLLDLHNPYAEAYRQRAVRPVHTGLNFVLDTVAAFAIWILNMLTIETVLVVANAAGAAVFFAEEKQDWALKLDFSFLAFAIIFPLSFLLQSTFNRREQALSWFADFKTSVLSGALMTLTVDWPNKEGDPSNGRLQLPQSFNTQVVRDYRGLIKLVYEYLSMPRVSHARNHIFWSKQRDTKNVHSRQNAIVQEMNDCMYDFSLQTEEMKSYGFPSGEASRLHQYRQFMQQRFEHLRSFKYYRTPQATRSFGRVYTLLLPWMMGPYWAWVAETTSTAYATLLAAFTLVVLLGLLNVQQGLEDPFVSDYQSWMPGIDTIKFDFEMASMIQAIEQYYANAELQRALLTQKKQQSVRKIPREDLIDKSGSTPPAPASV